MGGVDPAYPIDFLRFFLHSNHPFLWAKIFQPLPQAFFFGNKLLNNISIDQNAIIESLGGGFKYFLFSPLLGEMIQFD